jgi:hypothetical protein
MKKKSTFSSIGSLITKYSKNIDLERGLRETALKNIWGDIVGDVFKDNTRLYGVKTSINGDILLLTAKSSIVCQEFFIHKHQTLKKIAVSAYSLGFNIIDIQISSKYWKDLTLVSEQCINNGYYDVFTGVPTESELSSILLPDSLINSLTLTINEELYPDEKIRYKIFNIALKDIKTQVWRKNKGFPSCKNCGITVSFFKTGDDVLCPSCKYNK